MSDETPRKDQDPSDIQDHTQATNVSQGRRKLLAGLSASPILMSLSSRPVLGAQNCAPSGFMSGNLSDHNATGSCGGKSPGFWKNHLMWPSPYVAGTCKKKNGQFKCSKGVNPDGTKMKHVFQNPKFKDKTLLQVLWEKPGSIEFHIIAALLNSVAPLPSYALSEQEVKDIYNQLRSQGYYLTSSGVRMFAPDVRRFIENTYH